jgi:hypothetical protein
MFHPELFQRFGVIYSLESAKTAEQPIINNNKKGLKKAFDM